MSYDEHLISMAGGDGETVDRLAAIEARALNGDPSYHSHANAMEDRRTLLALVREQQAKLEAIGKITEKFDKDVEGMETVDQTGPLADEAISDIQTALGGWS